MLLQTDGAEAMEPTRAETSWKLIVSVSMYVSRLLD